MKRHGNLWNQIIDEENIRQGTINACRGKGRKTNTKKKNIEYTRNHVDETVVRIKRMLMRGFRTSNYHIYPLFDPKLRFIYCLPFFPDRIVHHCLLNVLAPIWDSMMYSQSCACRSGYGQHMAGTICGVYTKKYRYCAQFDISQFYVNINHRIMKQIVRKKIKDPFVVGALDEIIDSIDTRKKNLEFLYRMQEQGRKCSDIPREIQKLEYAESLDSSPAGLPIGNYTSQWLGNIYLNELDTYVKQSLRVGPYVRYCDDFLIFENDKKELHEKGKLVKQFLWDKLHMTLSKKEVFPTTQGVDFVGYRYFNDGLVLLRKRTMKRQKKMLKRIRGHIEDPWFDIEKARSQMGGMHGLLKWAKTYNFRKFYGVDELEMEVKENGKIQ